jgi:DNA-binding LytR/AlgR family response regulator
MKLTCLIVDDEPLARKGLAEYCAELEQLSLAGTCESVESARKSLAGSDVDLLLLDIQMPGMTGLDFLKTLTNPPMAIVITAYPEFALEGYSLDVIDYLLKPVTLERFRKAVNKALDFHRLKSVRSDSYFFVKSGGKYEKVMYDELLFVEAMQNYCILHLPDRKLITYMTLTGMEAQLPESAFMKVHKSFIVSVAAVKTMEGSELTIGPHRIPVSRTLKEAVTARVLGGRLLKRQGS